MIGAQYQLNKQTHENIFNLLNSVVFNTNTGVTYDTLFYAP